MKLRTILAVLALTGAAALSIAQADNGAHRPGDGHNPNQMFSQQAQSGQSAAGDASRDLHTGPDDRDDTFHMYHKK